MGANAGIGPWDEDLKHVEDVYLACGDFLIGEVDGGVVAMGALRPAGADVAELKRVRVAEEFQRRGIGEWISRTLLSRAHELGYTRVVLDTTTQQVPAQRLYEKLGFRETHRNSGVTGLELVFYERDLADWQDPSDGRPVQRALLRNRSSTPTGVPLARRSACDISQSVKQEAGPAPESVRLKAPRLARMARWWVAGSGRNLSARPTQNMLRRLGRERG
jgi:GNAT superfamily N-acetyltransferase